MAIYDFSIDSISRSAGHSATHEAAYISGSAITDERNGITIDYTRKRGVKGAEIIGPAHMDASWFSNTLEAGENRKNSQVGRKAKVALPIELDDAANWRLLHRLGTHLHENHGVGVMIAQHGAPTDGWSSGLNEHGHLLWGTRTMDAAGVLGKKTRSWDVKETSAVIVADLRATWARFVNEALAEAGSTATVDHRSLAERGIERPPRRHLERGEYIASKTGRAQSGWAKENRRVESVIGKQQQLDVINHELTREIRRAADREIDLATSSLAAGELCLGGGAIARQTRTRCRQPVGW